jgi:hypothetical protein
MMYSRFPSEAFGLCEPITHGTSSNAMILIQMPPQSAILVVACFTHTYTFDEVRELVSPTLQVETIWKDSIAFWDIPNYKQNVFVPDTPFQNLRS